MEAIKIIEGLRRADLYPLVSTRKLSHFVGFEWGALVDLAKTVGRFYEPFDIIRPGSTKRRHIDNPSSQLKAVQSAIQRRLLSYVRFPEMMFGAIPNRSARDSAAIHVSQPYVVTIDLQDCFPNTNHHKVYGVWARLFGCSAEIAGLLTQLTTFQRRLPQGAPTSALLENLTLSSDV
jgi:hypothetical protein